MSSTCAFCDSKDLDLICDFGHMGLAGAFLTEEGISAEKKFTMRLCFCRNCSAVQIVDKISPDEMFKQGYFYFSSVVGSLRAHFEKYAREIASELLEDPKSSAVLEFGCNDGVLLKPLSELCVGTLIGVDPASNVISSINSQNIHTINSYFDELCADKILSTFGQMDLILANNVFAHILDINGVTRAIEKCLAPDGVFVFEVHYLGNVVDELQYDMIYHEHIYYYSLIAIENHFDNYDMGVCNVRQIPNHGGSIRVYVCRKSSHRFSAKNAAVDKLREKEVQRGFNSSAFFKDFGARISNHRDQFITLLHSLKSAGAVIVGYGASGRANTMLQFCGIDSTILEYMVDDAPAKTGFFTPGSHLKIVSSIKNQDGNYPDYVVVFAWTFINEIVARNADYLEAGGKFIVALPEVQILDKSNITSKAGDVL